MEARGTEPSVWAPEKVRPDSEVPLLSPGPSSSSVPLCNWEAKGCYSLMVDGVFRSGGGNQVNSEDVVGRGSRASIPHGASSFKLQTALLGSFDDGEVRKY